MSSILAFIFFFWCLPKLISIGKMLCAVIKTRENLVGSFCRLHSGRQPVLSMHAAIYCEGKLIDLWHSVVPVNYYLETKSARCVVLRVNMQTLLCFFRKVLLWEFRILLEASNILFRPNSQNKNFQVTLKFFSVINLC